MVEYSLSVVTYIKHSSSKRSWWVAELCREEIYGSSPTRAGVPPGIVKVVHGAHGAHRRRTSSSENLISRMFRLRDLIKLVAIFTPVPVNRKQVPANLRAHNHAAVLPDANRTGRCQRPYPNLCLLLPIFLLTKRKVSVLGGGVSNFYGKISSDFIRGRRR